MRREECVKGYLKPALGIQLSEISKQRKYGRIKIYEVIDWLQ